MKAFALAAFAVAMPMMAVGTAQAATPLPTDKAADLVLRQCVDHALGTGAIVGQNGAQLDAKGLAYQREPPPFLVQTQSTSMGKAEYAKSPSTEGEVWGVGYDGGGCMVVTAGTAVEPIEKAYAAYFGQPNMWRSERISGTGKGERLLQFGYSSTRTTRLVATISLRDDDGVSSVTIKRLSR